jgi:K+-transporting ATPase ATPase C chain
VALAQWLFPQQANGSVLKQQGQIVGSRLVGQPFVSARYFHSRPSASNYNVDAMAGSNLAMANPELQQLIQTRAAQFAQKNQITKQQVPDDMITASGSGIDPHISPESALLQLKRVAAQRQLPEPQLRQLVQQHIQPAQFGLYGQARVNVLELNLALDQLSMSSGK